MHLRASMKYVVDKIKGTLFAAIRICGSKSILLHRKYAGYI